MLRRSTLVSKACKARVPDRVKIPLRVSPFDTVELIDAFFGQSELMIVDWLNLGA